MNSLIAIPLLDGTLSWQTQRDQKEPGFTLRFNIGKGHLSRRESLQRLQRLIEQNSLSFITPGRERWQIDINRLDTFLAGIELGDIRAECSWVDGVIDLVPDVVHFKHVPPPRSRGSAGTFTIYEERTLVEFAVFKEDHLLEKNVKLFLSHKGANKPMVREFFMVLKTMGFMPWLDEDAMPWGTNLRRGILQGFKDSCAAIFFITPQFQDEGYLAEEIDLARQEKHEKHERFTIITINLRDEIGNAGTVPDLLKPYVYGQPVSHLEALNGILRGLPIHAGPITWKTGIS